MKYLSFILLIGLTACQSPTVKAPAGKVPADINASIMPPDLNRRSLSQSSTGTPVFRREIMTNHLHIAWHAPIEDGWLIDGYRLYTGTNQISSLTNQLIDGNITNGSISLVYYRTNRPVRWFFWVRTISGEDESLPSNVVHYPPYPPKPIGQYLEWQNLSDTTIYQSPSLSGPWSVLGTTNSLTSTFKLTYPPINDQMYFRATQPSNQITLELKTVYLYDQP